MARWTPSIVPEAAGHTFYLVIQQHGGSGLFPETTLDRTDLEDVLYDLASGQYDRPLEVIAFNPTEGWSRNVTEDVAAELQRRADIADNDLPVFIAAFVSRNTRHDRQLVLRDCHERRIHKRRKRRNGIGNAAAGPSNLAALELGH